jgi:DNA-binding MarR family transcriptional regulator
VPVDEDSVRGLEGVLGDLVRSQRARARKMAQDLHQRLEPATYPLIVVLGRTGPQRLSSLVKMLELDKSTLSRQVDAAVRAGLVERVPDPDDARARLVALTDEGRARFTEQYEHRLRRWRASLEDWAPGDVRELTRLLRRLVDSYPD